MLDLGPSNGTQNVRPKLLKHLTTQVSKLKIAVPIGIAFQGRKIIQFISYFVHRRSCMLSCVTNTFEHRTSPIIDIKNEKIIIN